jgi:hypothetical protein
MYASQLFTNTIQIQDNLIGGVMVGIWKYIKVFKMVLKCKKALHQLQTNT